MNIDIVINQIRLRCPLFGNRVAGAAEFKGVDQNNALAAPCAYVIPLAEVAEDNRSQNDIIQEVRESFAVIVCVGMGDERGQASHNIVHDIRALLFSALLGFEVDEDCPIDYEGAALLALNRGRMWYQYEFGTTYQVDVLGTWQHYKISNLPPLEIVHMNTDVIDPIADPNLQAPGPDGRSEFQSKIQLEQE